MGKELEALEHIYYGSQGYGETDKYYKFLKEYLESIDNANPSEALGCLERVKDYLSNVYDYKEIIEEVRKDIDNIKQALLKAQEPKQYLKWEDLEFKENNEYSYFKVKLGDNVYKAFSYFSYVFNKDTVVIRANNQFAITEDNKQFFNDLRLERVEE